MLPFTTSVYRHSGNGLTNSKLQTTENSSKEFSCPAKMSIQSKKKQHQLVES
jgi:hypothetical protein